MSTRSGGHDALNMKGILKTLVVVSLLIGSGCEKESNQKLYDEVMAIHDDVMPKMNDLYKAKTALKKQLEDTTLSDREKQEIHAKIARIDSADE